jgi:hypothetical protein
MSVVCVREGFEALILEPLMTNFPQPRSRTRAPRVSLRGSVSVLIQLENLRRIPAKLHQLSITGGLLELAAYVDERASVEMKFQMGSSVLCPKAEMLFPLRGAHGYMQPFRFTRLWAEESQILEAEITELLKRSVTPAPAGHGSGFRPPRFYLESF